MATYRICPIQVGGPVLVPIHIRSAKKARNIQLLLVVGYLWEYDLQLSNPQQSIDISELPE
jgi:hypothetical protein